MPDRDEHVSRHLMIPSQQAAKSALRAGRKAKERSLPEHRAV
jgi:hypothetical protein